jgi:TetR/AcrR family transcriptional regulator, cholesterol catabolism regulator
MRGCSLSSVLIFSPLDVHYPEGIKARVIALRDQDEKLFVDLIDELPLRKGVDRRYLRLAIIGALSWPLFWFKKDRDTPTTIAKKMLSMRRAGVQDAD